MGNLRKISEDKNMDDQKSNLILIDIHPYIWSLPFFSIFSEAEKEYLSSLNSHTVSCKPDHVIVRQGDNDASLYILFKGQARVFKSERPNVVLANRISGEIFGEITFRKKSVRKVNVVADSDCIFLEINGPVFEKMSAEIQNKFRARFLDILTARLDDLSNRYTRDAR